MSVLKRFVPWVLALVIIAVFAPSLLFKYGDVLNMDPATTAVSRNLFTQIDATMQEWFGFTMFEPYGRYVIGAVEGIAVILLLVPGTQGIGGIIAFVLMSGAVFFHIFTQLGVSVVSEAPPEALIEQARAQLGANAPDSEVYLAAVQLADKDSSLFMMAIMTAFCGLILAFVRRKAVMAVFGR